MTTEYENKTIWMQRWIMISMGAFILILISSMSYTKNHSFTSINFLIEMSLFGLLIWAIYRRTPEHTMALVNKIQVLYKEYTGKYPNIKGYEQVKLADKAYFYFPNEYQGIEYDMKKQAVIGVRRMPSQRWLKETMENNVLQKILERDIVDMKEKEIKEERGYVEKDK